MRYKYNVHCSIYYDTITTKGAFMKTKTWIWILVCVGVVAVLGGVGFYQWPIYQEYKHQKEEQRKEKDYKDYEKTIAKGAIKNMSVMKKGVERYFKHPHNSSSDAYLQSDILLQEIMKLAELDLRRGQWDSMGVYSSPNFVYLGGCYSNWCYIEANRKENSYTLYMQYNGKKWEKKYCSTQLTELGRYICKHLEKHGWKYVEEEL